MIRAALDLPHGGSSISLPTDETRVPLLDIKRVNDVTWEKPHSSFKSTQVCHIVWPSIAVVPTDYKLHAVS